MSHRKQPLSWLDKLRASMLHAPKNREQLISILREAQAQHILEHEALTMIEGVLQISEMQARDIMIPRTQMIVINKQAELNDIIKIMHSSTHSRFPVIDEDRDDVEGIVLAKDLLPFAFDTTTKFDLRTLLRPAIFIPESKRLNILLKEFRDTKNHMAIVADEYGGVAGLVTIEDVLEQIVGEIEDEFDIDPNDFIKKLDDYTYTVKAFTTMKDFNEYFEKPLEKQGCDTIGGLVIKHFGHLPKRNEVIRINNYTFKILHADSRKIRMLEINIDR